MSSCSLFSYRFCNQNLVSISCLSLMYCMSYTLHPPWFYNYLFFWKGRNYDGPHYEPLSIFLLFAAYKAQTFASAPCQRTLSIYGRCEVLGENHQVPRTRRCRVPDHRTAHIQKTKLWINGYYWLYKVQFELWINGYYWLYKVQFDGLFFEYLYLNSGLFNTSETISKPSCI